MKSMCKYSNSLANVRNTASEVFLSYAEYGFDKPNIDYKQFKKLPAQNFSYLVSFY